MSAGTTVPIKLTIAGQGQVVSAFHEIQRAAVGFQSAMRGIDGVSSAFRALVPSLAAAFSGASLAGAFKSAVDGADNFGKLSQKVGATTEALSALAYAGKLSDVGLEDLSSSLEKYGRHLTQTGQGSADLLTALQAEADVFAKLADGPTKTARAMDLFGKSGAKMIPLLNGGSEGLREMTQEAERLGLVISSQTAEQAQQFNDNLTRLESTSKGLATSFTQILLPSLNDVTKTLVATNKSAWSALGGGGLAQSVLSPFTEAFRAQAGQTIAATTAVTSFFKTLATGGGLKDSVGAAINEAVNATARFRGELEKLNTEVKKGTKDQTGFVAALDDTARRLDLELLSGRNRIASIDGDPTINTVEARRQKLAVYADQLEVVAKLQDELQAKTPANAVMFTDESGQPRVTEEWLKSQQEAIALQREKIGLMNQRDRLGEDPENVMAQMKSVAQEIQNSFGTVAQQVAASFKTVIGTAISSISDGITGLIMRTQTWAQALRSIGTSILTSLVHSIVQMGVQWAVGFAIQKTLGTLAVKSAMKDAASLAAAWGPPAVLAAIATEGSAAGVGLASTIAAMAIGTGAATAMSGSGMGFADGGYTGDGPRHEVAGYVHRGEYVLDAMTVDRIGLPALQALQVEGGSHSAPIEASRGPAPVNNAFFDSRVDAQRWAESRDGEVWFVDMAKRTRHQWRA